MPYLLPVVKMILGFLATELMMKGGAKLGGRALGSAAAKMASRAGASTVGKAATQAMSRAAAASPMLGKVLPSSVESGLGSALRGAGGIANLGVSSALGFGAVDALLEGGPTTSGPTPEHEREVALMRQLMEEATTRDGATKAADDALNEALRSMSSAGGRIL